MSLFKWWLFFLSVYPYKKEVKSAQVMAVAFNSLEPLFAAGQKKVPFLD